MDSALLLLLIVAQFVLLLVLLRRSNAKVDYLLNVVNNLRFSDEDKVSSSQGGVDEGSDYVASVTTIQSRLHLVDRAIRSMLAQSVPPRGVYLYISDRIEPGEIPQKLRKLEQCGLTIRLVQDVGPHTKLVYALKEHAQYKIITFDDDMIYPSNTAACLLHYAARFPACVVANWARRLHFCLGRVLPSRCGTLLTPPGLERNIEQSAHAPIPSLRTFAYGTSGVLYPPGALHEKVFDFKLMRELCPTEDDVWFKAMSILAGTRTVETNLGINPRHYCVSGSQVSALRHTNQEDRQNGRQLRAVFAAFDLHALVRKGE